MNYSDEDALKEVLKRKDKIIRRRSSKTCGYLAAAGTALFAALVTVISVLPAGSATPVSGGSIYGAFLLGREAGGYVLAAVIAFILGVVVTLLCIKYRQIKDKTDING